MMLKLFFMSLSVLLSEPVLAIDLTNVFVQSQITQLRKHPQISADSLMDLKRGDELLIIKKEGLWLQVKTTNQREGWIPQILTSTIKPLEPMPSFQEASPISSHTKASNQPSRNSVTSASARGLSASEKNDSGGDESFPINRQAVEDLDKLRITPQQVKKFKDEAQLISQ